MKRTSPIPVGQPTTTTPIDLPDFLSSQQTAVIDWISTGRGNLFLEARAGTGKTFTLVHAAPYMEGSVAFAVFNRRNADETIPKLRHLTNVDVSTFHSYGMRAWRSAAPHIRVDARGKYRRMMDENKISFPFRSAVDKMVSIAKQTAIGVMWITDDIPIWHELIDKFDIRLEVDNNHDSPNLVDDLIDMANRCLHWSDDVGETLINFDDMIWLPLVRGVPIPTYDWVLVDECQDTNPARRLLAKRMMNHDGRAIFVGDRHQAIYGFTGADNDAVDILISDFECSTLPLSVTYRCSKSATSLAQSIVPDITAHDDNPEGSISRLTPSEFKRSHLPIEGLNPTDPLRPGDAVLCRNTKPLVSLAWKLIREGVPCHVEGKDIGRGLMRLVRRWKVETIDGLIRNLEAYREGETRKFLASKSEYRIEALNDKIDTILVLTEGCDTTNDLADKISRMFEDTDVDDGSRRITLSTVHKAKGREWERVIILGYLSLMPSKFATQEWELEQESNIRYVGITRTKRDLVLVDGHEV